MLDVYWYSYINTLVQIVEVIREVNRKFQVEKLNLKSRCHKVNLAKTKLLVK